MKLVYPKVKPLTAERAEQLGADPERQRVIDQILSADTLEEVAAAKLIHHAWLVANPDDIGVLEAGELLAYLEEDLRSLGEDGPIDAASPTGCEGRRKMTPST